MKKIMLSLVLSSYFFVCSAQRANLDSIQLEDRMNKIETNVSNFYKESRTSQSLIIAGTVLVSVGSFLSVSQKNASQNNLQKTTLFAGSACLLVGSVVYFDSYKWLNIKSKRKFRKPVDDIYF